MTAFSTLEEDKAYLSSDERVAIDLRARSIFSVSMRRFLNESST